LIDAMQFSTRKRRQAPTVIIVSLIDVLIVVLIFLMVTTTFKQLPAIKLALPESKQSKAGASDNALIVTVSKDGMLYLKTDPVTMDTLQQRLVEAVRLNPQTTLAIRADTDTTMGKVIKVMDAAKAANIKAANIFTRPAE
jgi:biopolymer transport protein ExbD